MSSLETRYRRLLAAYPRDHRARHEEEMLGVLLAGARPGQTRPRPADVPPSAVGTAHRHVADDLAVSVRSGDQRILLGHG
ncbi:hypothetical protein ACWEPN_42680, partial [Nonomuraea wenchangensis]